MTKERELNTGQVQQLIIAGWTGRDVNALEKHIVELEALGVRRPKSTPIFYRVAADLLTTEPSIQVLGDRSSGEVECVLHAVNGEVWVGVGSDHTDRAVETVGVSLSKQMCAKPVGARLWHYDDIAPHWDKLIIRSFAHIKGSRRLYQEGAVSCMRPPAELVRMYTGQDRLPQGHSMFCGTLAVHGGVEPADEFEMELEDPVLHRKIGHRYIVKTLPNEG